MSSLLLSLHPPLSHKSHHIRTFISKFPPSSTLSISTKSHICFSTSNNNSHDREESRWLREEQRWLREEQRWLREEQRWLREEQRWNTERQSLLNQISTLLQLLKKEGDTPTAKSFSQTKEIVNQITESGSTVALPFELEVAAATAAVEEEEVVVKEVIKSFDIDNEVKEVKKKRVTLRKGAEGDDVKAMQEALEKLGFYSGEEDMEFSNFSSGTERAVKTWQSTFDAPETGIMTSELLERLFEEEKALASAHPLTSDAIGSDGTAKVGANGAAFTSVLKASEIQQIVSKVDVAEIETSEHRVFLLGENRWEDSSRLTKNKKVGQGNNTLTCVTCRGEGRLLCEECDGTGEPNIEEQFLEWVEEGMKCPYCEGLGYSICDACEGKPLIST